ncbi:hypothetical protein BBK82_12605 [Lentzea guizhouensis]|uniref:Uncharacterized protein n=1 Tax=Lentzea guizhouensis TaxID=1586287 RepID=A0A1B2HGE7_9PSEU|nr:hypothetical protein BBK82_12605 [Lentzea guizhouensis]
MGPFAEVAGVPEGSAAVVEGEAGVAVEAVTGDEGGGSGVDGAVRTGARGRVRVGWSGEGVVTCGGVGEAGDVLVVSSSSVGHWGSSGKRASVGLVRAMSHPPAAAPMRVDRASWSTLVASRMGYMSEDQWSSTS